MTPEEWAGIGKRSIVWVPYLPSGQGHVGVVLAKYPDGKALIATGQTKLTDEDRVELDWHTSPRREMAKPGLRDKGPFQFYGAWVKEYDREQVTEDLGEVPKRDLFSVATMYGRWKKKAKET